MAGALNVTMVLAALRTAETNISSNDSELVLGLYYLTKFGYMQPTEVPILRYSMSGFHLPVFYYKI
jgi:hypothetical protein